MFIPVEDLICLALALSMGQRCSKLQWLLLRTSVSGVSAFLCGLSHMSELGSFLPQTLIFHRKIE